MLIGTLIGHKTQAHILENVALVREAILEPERFHSLAAELEKL